MRTHDTDASLCYAEVLRELRIAGTLIAHAGGTQVDVRERTA
ncbi:hypothetical protein [Streptomyces sp. SLBN-118]|nr:hypothetical protein [Streptomyces sp. SLBN-118]